jgi:seryl-tRNA synthetase
MLDIRRLRTDPSAPAAQLARRGYRLDVSEFQALEEQRKRLQVEVEELRAKRKSRAREIGVLRSRGEAADELIADGEKIAGELDAKESAFADVAARQRALLLDIPNLPHDSIPDGGGEEDNKEIRKWGEPPAFDFTPKDHPALGGDLGMMDFELAAKLAGARFVVLRGELARAHRALAQFMLDLHTREHGYQEVYVPYLSNPAAMLGSGQLPKFGEEVFCAEKDEMYLIPTAEAPLANFARERAFTDSDLPLKLVAHTPCFRREAGSYGKDTRGMLRQHQFDKVELVQIAAPEKSYQALEELTAHAEEVLRRLEIPYRVVSLCAGDIGFAAAKTYDLEAWLPGQNRYREISSCSNCEAFQARRMEARYRGGEDSEKKYVHTLNGSGVAVGRALIALMENGQTKSGDIRVPPALRPYLGGADIIKRR